MSAPGAPLTEDERTELNRLRSTVNSLAASNEVLVSSIHTLSGELLKRQHTNGYPSTASCDPTVPKRYKHDTRPPLSYGSSLSVPSSDDGQQMDFGMPSSSTEITRLQPSLSISSVPPEVLLQILSFVDRVDIDNCRLVNRRWQSIIDTGNHLLRPRYIRLLKVVDNGSHVVTISASSGSKCIKFNLNNDQAQHVDGEMIKRLTNLLKESVIKRTVICNLVLTELWAYDLYTIFKRANVKFLRFELIGIAIDQLTHDSFQKFIGEQIPAKVYFLDGIRNADGDYFNSRLLERKNIIEAEDFTVYDVSNFAGDEVILDLGDESLLDFFFGRNMSIKHRTSIYLDSPAISQSFVYSALLRFVHETNVESMMQHAEFAHVRDQNIHSHRLISMEYDTTIQGEWSARNKKTDLVLEVKVTRAVEDEDLVHGDVTVTMDICSARKII